MATSPTISFLFAMLVFVSLFSSLCRKVNCVDRLQGFELAMAEDFRQGSTCLESKVPAAGPYSLKVVHRHGPCSPVRDDDPPPTDIQILSRDARRAAYLHDQLVINRRIRELRGNVTSTTDATVLDVRQLAGYSYVTTVGLGTPAKEQTLVIDTASSLCWLQCKPCHTCYEQDQPIFDPHTSSSYHNITCGTQPCLHVHIGRMYCAGNTCAYRMAYADESSSDGFLATERVTLPDSGIVLENFVLGCGYSNQGVFHGAAGMLGLGPRVHSFARQVIDRYHLGDDVFSYCLPGSKNRAGHLTFGRRNRAVPSPAYTRMVYPFGMYGHGYNVEFLGISVAGRWLSIGPAYFAKDGTIIDSGTTFTWLPPVAYGALRDAFRQGMTKYRLAPPYGYLDTCYNITTPSFQYPAITLHFRGVDLSLKPGQVFYDVVHDSVYCLAFVAKEEHDSTIIGNILQRGMEVIFDNEMHRIGFSTGSDQC